MAQLADLGQEEADVDRPVARSVEAVDDDAVVDDPDPEPDDIRPEALGRLAGGPDRVLREEKGVEELDLGAGRLDRRSEALQPVGRDRRHPLEGVGVDQQGPKRDPAAAGRAETDMAV